MLLGEDEARRLIAEVLGYRTVEHCTVALRQQADAHTRFARGGVTTSGYAENLSLTVSASTERRTGTVSLNERDPAALRTAVAQAEQIARLAPPNPEWMEPLPPQDYPAIDAYDEAVAGARAADRLGDVREVLAAAAARGLEAAGFFTDGVVVEAFGTSTGNVGYHRATSVRYSATLRTPDGAGSGRREGFGRRRSDVAAAEVARVAIAKAEASRHPRRIEPGDYPVILEPHAVADLLWYLAGSLDARAADEGRGPLSRPGAGPEPAAPGGTRLGERYFAPGVTLRSDPFDPRLPGWPWVSEHLPAQRRTWIEDGTVRALAYSRYWAAQQGQTPTGSPSSLALAGGAGTLDDLIRATPRALLVTRFWYVRVVNPQTAQLTGLTRDGLFWVEDGAVRYPVQNLRFNESPIVLLQNVEAMSEAVRAGGAIVPALRAANFTFTSVSDAV